MEQGLPRQASPSCDKDRRLVARQAAADCARLFLGFQQKTARLFFGFQQFSKDYFSDFSKSCTFSADNQYKKDKPSQKNSSISS